VLGGVAVAAVAGAVVAVVALGGGEAEPPEAAPPRVDRIPLGPGAGAGPLAADASGAYVLDPVRRRVVKILSSTRQLTRLPLPGEPRALDISDDGETPGSRWPAAACRRSTSCAGGPPGSRSGSA